MPVEVDILEDSIFLLSPELLNILLKDHTMSKEDIQHNIFWATSDYEHLGKEYQYDSPILILLPEITGMSSCHVSSKAMTPKQRVRVTWRKCSHRHGFAMRRTT